VSKKNESGVVEWVDPGDAPMLTDAYPDEAEAPLGDTFIRPSPALGQVRRGRPKLGAPKQQINIRLDADVLSLLRRNGSGWQTRINEMLRVALGLTKSG
jgi:uncharacterized protein (DUF4415 family)